MVGSLADRDARTQQLSERSGFLRVVQRTVLLLQASEKLRGFWDVLGVRHVVTIPCLTVVCGAANLCAAVRRRAVRRAMPRRNSSPLSGVPKPPREPYNHNPGSFPIRLLFWSLFVWNFYQHWNWNPQ